ncbi:putative arginine--tRNA ligase, cytoplasmic [Linderina pennispora]|uniref:arginine--tRNA ligase n=1 Tax=Linderina pennispora TaxID=61395 RepID=A0A1Y1W9P5_9FUNG|nr:putative arginine--tRNA ligase, cytoplasmic [Linderina pennispora]ORX70038.1 putative arginine--tRNA ligase, cytoplasmic [Linderina pennispora]
MLDEFKASIAKQLAELSGVSTDVILPAIDVPKATTHGDLAIAVPRLRLKGNPAQFANEWAEKYQPDEFVTGAVATGPYLNFRIERNMFTRKVLSAVYKEGTKYGFNESGEGKHVVVEFSSPNIAKPFHAGHLRSTIIGNFIVNLYRANGWKATSMNYLGDWGKQYGLLAVGFGKYGSEEKLVADPIQHLYEVYVAVNADAKENPAIDDEARAYFKKMEDGDQETLSLWQRFRDLSIAKYKDTYARLGLQFDVYSGESQVTEGMHRAMKMLEDFGLLEESEGAKIIDLEKHKKHLGKAVVQKKDGTTLYLTRDIGAALERIDTYNFDKIVYVVSSQQDLHLKQLFKTLELLKVPYADRFQHINYGLVKGMSTRKGTVVFLDDMLRESADNMHAVMKENEAKYAQVPEPEQTAATLGLSAIVVQDMSARRIKDYDFNWDRILSFEGTTGPYLQYAHARLCSMERRAAVKVNPDADITLLTEPAAQELVDLVSRYPDLLATTLQQLEPCSIVQYLFKLSHAVSVAWESLWVHNQPTEIAEARLLMYWSARTVLGNGLTLIGLTPVERM